MTPSIRQRLFRWFVLVLLLISVAFSVPVFLNAHEEVNELFDKVLRETAYSWLNTSATSGTALSIPSHQSAKDDIDLIVQTWDSNKKLLYRSHVLPPLPLAGTEGLSTLDWQNDKWRVFQLKSAKGLVQIAQSQSERQETANEIASHLLMPLVFLLPCLGGLAWFGLGWSLRPLEDVVNAVNTRNPESLQAIPNERLPQEVSSLVTALNGLLHRLDQVLNKQRQFIADAAHELRTPLTAVSLQAQIAERVNDPEKRSSTFSDLRQGIARASHVVQQLLTMARLDPESTPPVSTPLHLDELIRNLLTDFMPLANARKLDLVTAIGGTTPILGDADTLRILFGNVLENAIRYTPEGERVEVSVLAKGDNAYLEVDDNGIGIPDEERTRIFDRFYRVLGNKEPGSGLGLAIVKRIADQHGASIVLSDGKSGKGLNVSIGFPVYRHES